MFLELPLLLWMCLCILLGLEHVGVQGGTTVTVPSKLNVTVVPTILHVMDQPSVIIRDGIQNKEPNISESNNSESNKVVLPNETSTIPINTPNEPSQISKGSNSVTEKSSLEDTGQPNSVSGENEKDKQFPAESDTISLEENDKVNMNNNTGHTDPGIALVTSGLNTADMATQPQGESLSISKGVEVNKTVSKDAENYITAPGSPDVVHPTKPAPSPYITLPGAQGINTTYNSPVGTKNNTNSETSGVKTFRPTDFTTAANSYENTALITQIGERVSGENMHKGEVDQDKSNNMSTNTQVNDAKDVVNNTLLVVTENSAKSVTTQGVFMTSEKLKGMPDNSTAQDSIVTSNQGVTKKSDSKTSQFVTTQVSASSKGQTIQSVTETVTHVLKSTQSDHTSNIVLNTSLSDNVNMTTVTFVTTKSSVHSSQSDLGSDVTAQTTTGPGGRTQNATKIFTGASTTQKDQSVITSHVAATTKLVLPVVTSTESMQVTQSSEGIATTYSDIVTMQATSDKDYTTTEDLLTFTEFTSTHNGSSTLSTGGLSKTAQIGIGIGSVVLFWIILGPLVCLICRLKDKAKARNEPDDEKPRESFSHNLMEEYIMTELARGREKMYETTLTSENEVHKLNDSSDYEQSVDAEITSF